MRGDVAERARAGFGFLQTPDARKVRVNDPVLQVGAAKVTNLADAAFIDQLPGKLHGGGAAIIVTEHVYDAVALHRVEHLLGFTERVGERLLAEDGFFGFGGGNGDRLVRIAGRADIDDIDVRAGDDLFPAGRRLGPAEFI